MVRTHSDTQKLDNLYKRNRTKRGESIFIESDFQRGTEDKGVWSPSQQQTFIDSLQKNYPIGILTFVMNEESEESCWRTLDGGNRMRAIRDYKNNMYVDKGDEEEKRSGRKYEELTPGEQARFDSILIPCQWITIEPEDPDTIITEMFTRLNTTAKPLSQGELCKAHGWKKDTFELELAKKIIGDKWSSSIVGYEHETNDLREKWSNTFNSEFGETSRCDTLACMTGFIVSARTGVFSHFDKKYSVLRQQFVTVHEHSAEDTMTIYRKLSLFCDVMGHVYNKKIFGKVTMGMVPMSKVAPIWKLICENEWSPEIEETMIGFYKKINDSTECRRDYENILKGDGDNHYGDNKVRKVIEHIKQTMS